jgi:predicted DNA-binding ribbon-helix-helix protein
MWNDHIPSLTYPELLSFSKNKAITFQKVASSVPLHQLFHLPLSEIAFAQLLSLEQVIQGVALTHEPDSRTCMWGSNFYSSTRAYKQLTGHSQVHTAFKWLWNSSYQTKHKVFCWLLLKRQIEHKEYSKKKINDIGHYVRNEQRRHTHRSPMIYMRCELTNCVSYECTPSTKG